MQAQLSYFAIKDNKYHRHAFEQQDTPWSKTCREKSDIRCEEWTRTVLPHNLPPSEEYSYHPCQKIPGKQPEQRTWMTLPCPGNA